MHFATVVSWESLTEALLKHGGNPLRPNEDLREIVPGQGFARDTPLDLAVFQFLSLYQRKEAGEEISDGIFSEESVFRQVKGNLLKLLRASPRDGDLFRLPPFV